MATSWSAGYVLDIPYTSGFYRELAPSYLSFVGAGLGGARVPPLRKGAAYAELACGQGFGTALLAAANPHIDFYGFDFNPAQIANAKKLVADAGLTNAFFFDQSFEESVNAPADAFPKFDVIVGHGIYSWISKENRDFIVRFIRERLNPGGLVYISYNCMPGWASAAPLQRLMREHANRNPERSDRQVEAALAFANRLREGGANYFASTPSLAPRMDRLKTQNRNYLAHEYLNGYWHPLYFLDVQRELEAARLDFVCSATIAEGIDLINLPKDLQPLAGEIHDRGWLETIRDFAANRQFRRDIYMRGAPSMSAIEQQNLLRGLKFALAAPITENSFKFAGPLGEVSGNADVYPPLVELLKDGPKTLQDLHQLPYFREKNFATLLQAVLLLTHNQTIVPLPFDARGKSADIARNFNRVAAGRIRNGDNAGYLAAPAAGTGVSANYVELGAVLALLENPKLPLDQIAQFIWQIMSATGQRLLREGKPLQSREENLLEVGRQLEKFSAEKLPLWRNLGVV